ncbi:MAG: hypothetical protein JXA71_19460, partial [Chitinispirillaceae bacterium]|nr:hypothetical protein [Chitinispirillaceae bacterium]
CELQYLMPESHSITYFRLCRLRKKIPLMSVAWKSVLVLLGSLSIIDAAPVLLKTVDISAAGTGKRMLLGDVTGDGRLEMVMMQADKMDDDRYIGHEVNCLTVYTVDGTRLWQKGNPSAGGAAGSDIAAQVYDIDQDGWNEVLACMNGRFRVFDGKTGTEKYSFPYPHQNAHDCIIIANVTGTPKPQDIILKDRYNQIWAMDRTGKQLWTYRGNTGHFPWPFDFDKDGREEIICGFDYLTPDGKKEWSMDQSGHADCIWVGDIDQNPANGTEIAVGGDDVTVYRQNGSLFWRNNQPVEPQNIAIGDFLHDQQGLEIGGQDRVDRGTPGSEAIFVLSSTGKTSYYQTRSGWGSIAYWCQNWDGIGSDHIMIWRGPERPALYDGKIQKVASFNEGYMMTGDLNGDGRDEIITFTESNAYIYSSSTVDLSKAAPGCPAPRQQQKRHYNFTRYWGGEYTKQHISSTSNSVYARSDGPRNVIITPVFSAHRPLRSRGPGSIITAEMYSINGKRVELGPDIGVPVDSRVNGYYLLKTVLNGHSDIRK